MVSLATINENLPTNHRASADERSRLPALRRGVTPVAGQSLRGLAAHSLRHNGVKVAWRVLSTVGSPARNRVLLSEHPAVSTERLAAVLRVDKRTVHQRMYSLLASGERSFFGLPVPHAGIENRVRRFAPTFLKENRHHLAAWELRLLPFCPVSWDILLSTCPCRPGRITTQGWTRTGSYPDQCDHCGRSLNRLATLQVPEQKRKDLLLVTALVVDATHGRDGWRGLLPANLEGVDAADLFRVLHSLADNIVPPIDWIEATDPISGWRIDFEIWAKIERLGFACEALMGWPYAIEDMRFDLAEDSAVLVKLLKDYCALGNVRDGVDGQGVEKARKPVSPARKDLRVVGMREAAAFARLTPETLQSLWNAGLITRHVRPHGGRILSAFGTSELAEVADRWRERLDFGSVAYRLGITRYGLEQLMLAEFIEVKAITTADHERAFLEPDVAEFEKRLVEMADPAIVEGSSMSEVFRAVSGRPKPWGLLVAAMLEGTVKYGLVDDTGPVFDRIAFVLDSNLDAFLTSGNELYAEQNGLSSSLCQTDALEILNCSASNLAILDGLDSQGRNPRMFERQAVLDLAANVVATAEIAEKLAIHSARVARIMKSAGIHEKVRGGWPRERTERFVRHVHKLQAAQIRLPFDGSVKGH